MIYSPLEQFEVSNLLSMQIPLLGYLNISLTNLGLYSILVIFIISSLHILGNNNFSLIPSKWSIGLEASYGSLLNLIKQQIGSKNEIYFPAIYSLFFFILISNLTGNIPYSFTITTSAILAIGLSLTIFLGVTILGLTRHRLHFFSFFIPSGTPFPLIFMLVPIEIISYSARAFSLGLRLCANMVAGHTLMHILSGFILAIASSSILGFIFSVIPLAIFTCIISLEIAVSLIQAYVFCILTSSYIKDAIDLH